MINMTAEHRHEILWFNWQAPKISPYQRTTIKLKGKTCGKLTTIEKVGYVNNAVSIHRDTKDKNQWVLSLCGFKLGHCRTLKDAKIIGARFNATLNSDPRISHAALHDAKMPETITEVLCMVLWPDVEQAVALEKFFI